MVEIARLPLARDRNTWASTNLLLDPSGEFRNYEMAAPRRADALDENLFDESPNENGGTGYGQAEFESSWDGGLDVRVLDRRYFRSSTGKLSRKQFDYDQQHAEDLLYFHCVCCGDPVSSGDSCVMAARLTLGTLAVYERLHRRRPRLSPAFSQLRHHEPARHAQGFARTQSGRAQG